MLKKHDLHKEHDLHKQHHLHKRHALSVAMDQRFWGNLVSYAKCCWLAWTMHIPILLPESIACPWAKHGELPETTQWTELCPLLFPDSIEWCCQLRAAGSVHTDGQSSVHSITKIYCRASKIRAAWLCPHSIVMKSFVGSWLCSYFCGRPWWSGRSAMRTAM